MSRTTTERMFFEDSGRHIFLLKPSPDSSKLSNRIPLIIFQLLGGENVRVSSSLGLLFVQCKAPCASPALFTESFNPIIQLVDLLQQMCPLCRRIGVSFLSWLWKAQASQH